ncbi:hypothetical protein B4N89_37095 [Embleya scabrispora]|uniref:Uncharacterized protein n=1 Tax=Embleya scabrispora TaxID=159449 RepID=A0A1T3NM07_9ACTN|nr:hypothetical protein B4N89_37095 [Embleya scabrispora]
MPASTPTDVTHRHLHTARALSRHTPARRNHVSVSHRPNANPVLRRGVALPRESRSAGLPESAKYSTLGLGHVGRLRARIAHR